MDEVDPDFTRDPLVVVESVYGWSVKDPARGRWLPYMSAYTEIETADDPAATALRICTETPERGMWYAITSNDDK